MKKIKFKPIKLKEGYIGLSIYPPKTFMEHIKDYMIMIGGCGVDHCKSLKEAKNSLLENAIKKCDYRINKAQKEIDLYQKEKNKLLKRGLIEIK